MIKHTKAKTKDKSRYSTLQALTTVTPVCIPRIGHQPVRCVIFNSPAEDPDRMTSNLLSGDVLIDAWRKKQGQFFFYFQVLHYPLESPNKDKLRRDAARAMQLCCITKKQTSEFLILFHHWESIWQRKRTRQHLIRIAIEAHHCIHARVQQQITPQSILITILYSNWTMSQSRWVLLTEIDSRAPASITSPSS